MLFYGGWLYSVPVAVMSVIRIFFSFLPAPIQLLFFGFLAIFVIVIVFKVIAMVLDAIPFL